MSMKFPRVGDAAVIVVCFIFFSLILAPSADASGVPFAGGSDVIAFGADDSAEIVVSSDLIVLDMRYIDQDLYWDSLPHDVDGLLIRTTGYQDTMDCFFHLNST